MDRAKTDFLANVSHELRTPLTLILGPAEDSLADARDPLSPRQHERQKTLHRNALRLLKLVNTLLDFSRVEAGRLQASFEPTDLAALTVDLASTFRSAIERAGLRLVVTTEPSLEDVHVDRDMWEKITLNLLSNALKFTFEGEIEVSLRATPRHVVLRVRDTGTGIAQDELPRVFERFHRVRDARSRTHEGTGIGLALVSELVRLHGGAIGAESELGRGDHVHRDDPARDGAPRARAPPARAAAHRDRDRRRPLRRGGAPLAPEHAGGGRPAQPSPRGAAGADPGGRRQRRHARLPGELARAHLGRDHRGRRRRGPPGDRPRSSRSRPQRRDDAGQGRLPAPPRAARRPADPEHPRPLALGPRG